MGVLPHVFLGAQRFVMNDSERLIVTGDKVFMLLNSGLKSMIMK